MGGQIGLPPHVIINYTLREIDGYSRGVDNAQRGEMARMLWQAHCAAQFNGYAFAGKRLPKIEKRIQQILHPERAKASGRDSVAAVIAKMNSIAKKAGLPPPRPRKRER